MKVHNDGRTQDELCSELLARHADYLDGTLPSWVVARLQAHLTECGTCARYDRIVRRSMDLVRDLPVIEPSDDFEARLQHRLMHVRDEARLEPRSAGAAGAFAVAGVIALLAWSPLLMDDRQQRAGTATESLPVAQAVQNAFDAAFAAPAAAPMISLVTAGDWYPGPAPLLGSSPVNATLVSLPGPYSPLVVQPPVQRSVRTVSSEPLPE